MAQDNNKRVLLTREQILKAPDLKTAVVSVPEWGGDVMVWGLTGAERDSFEGSVLQGSGKNQKVNLQNLRAKLVALTVRDEDGKRLFNDEDIRALGQKSASALDRVYAKAQELAGLTDAAVEELTKN